MLVIGEKINATNKQVAAAIAKKDESFLIHLAKNQDVYGADFIDVNAGTGHGSVEQEASQIQWLIEVVQRATDKPLAIDSDSPGVIQAALDKYRGDRVLINSVTAEEERLMSIGSIAIEHKDKVWLVALAMGKEGIPENADKRLANCELIMTCLTKLGLEEEQVFFDPLVLPVATDTKQGLVTLKTLEQIKHHYPRARTVLGLSNISYGLPKRQLVNRTFLAMAAYAGLDAVILDPLDAKVMSVIKVANMLTGKDTSCRGYLRAHRQGNIID